jgi:hypothetical protein
MYHGLYLWVKTSVRYKERPPLRTSLVTHILLYSSDFRLQTPDFNTDTRRTQTRTRNFSPCLSSASRSSFASRSTASPPIRRIRALHISRNTKASTCHVDRSGTRWMQSDRECSTHIYRALPLSYHQASLSLRQVPFLCR